MILLLMVKTLDVLIIIINYIFFILYRCLDDEKTEEETQKGIFYTLPDALKK